MSARNFEIVISAFRLDAEDVLGRARLHRFKLIKLFKQGFECGAFMLVHWKRFHTLRNHGLAFDSARFLKAIKRLSTQAPKHSNA